MSEVKQLHVESFVKVMSSKIEIGKKFKKTDMAMLLRLLDPTIPEQTLEGYGHNNAGWKKGNILYHFNKLFFGMFIASLQMREPPGTDEISEKYDYRYLDYILKETVDELKELKETVDELTDGLEGKGYVSEKEFYNMSKDKDNKIQELEEKSDLSEMKLVEQRRFFEDKIAHIEDRHKKRIINMEKYIEKDCD